MAANKRCFEKHLILICGMYAFEGTLWHLDIHSTLLSVCAPLMCIVARMFAIFNYQFLTIRKINEYSCYFFTEQAS